MPRLIFKPTLEAESDFSDVKRFYGDEVTISDNPLRADVTQLFGAGYIILVDDPINPERIAFADELYVEA